MMLEWNDKYEIGDAEIDAQHQELFSRINKFVTTTEKAGETTCSASLCQFTREHFAHEENLMQRINYSAMVDHVAQHNELIARLDQISSGVAKDTVDKAFWKSFISDWLVSHIAVYDSRLAAALQQQP